MSEPAKPRLSKAAVVAFVLGVSSLILLVVTALPALYIGLVAVRAVNGSDGQLRGGRLAVAGLILGGFSTLVTVLGCIALVLLNVQDKSQLAGCRNNLRQIGQAVATYYDHHPDVDHPRGRFPSAVVPNSALPPERRLSWQAAVLPSLVDTTPAGKKREKLAGEIAFEESWDSPANGGPRQANVAPFLCPVFAHEFTAGQAGLTSYVGVAGVGADAASLSKDNPRAGFFGYDRILTRSDISAATGSTMMVVETTRDNGPWLAGGPPTVRVLDADGDRYLGVGQPFGGLHRGGLNVLWADGSVGFVNDQIAPAVFRTLSRINREAGE
jgi:prepilin-type processing-associated H-X9-DG protein